jgi:hypothetical protein
LFQLFAASANSHHQPVVDTQTDPVGTPAAQHNPLQQALARDRIFRIDVRLTI